MNARTRDARRIVVKVGSSLVTNEGAGLDAAAIARWATQIAALRAASREVVLVSSGAIAEGMKRLGWQRRPHAMNELQAAAAVGQMGLAQVYETSFREHGLQTAQVLLTNADLADRSRYLNARSTLRTLLALGVVPVINENDTVATAEIRYGDNDRLAARVAQMVSADCLVLLSDIDGLYTADPHKDPSAEFIATVPSITPQIEAMGGGSASDVGSGGMATKIAAAKIAVAAGCHMCISAGAHLHPVRRIEQGARCTWFLPSESPVTARKQWIAGTLKPAGALVIDDGALRALESGKSLLPAGVARLSGRFDRGDTVSVVTLQGREVARGIAAYSDADAARIIGRRTAEIETILGFRGRDELIHRDDLVLQ
jgi:glutamate 5-kinase